MGSYRRWLSVIVGAIAAAILLPSITQAGYPTSPWPLLPVELVQTANPAPLIQQADEQFYSQDYAAAIRIYRQALDQFPPTASPSAEQIYVTHNLARAYLLTDQYEAALPLLETLDRTGQATPNMLNNLALAYYSLGQYSAAEQVLEQVLAQWEALREGDDGKDLDRVTLFEQQAHSYALMQRTLVAQGKRNEALAMAERSRARALVEVLVQAERRDRLPTPLTVPQIQAIAREQNTTLVMYSPLGNGRRILGNEVEVETDLFIWVISPSGDIQFRQQPLSPFWTETSLRNAPASDRSPLEALVSQTRNALGVGSRGLGVVPTERRITDDLPPSNPLPLRSLYEMLITPIAPLLPTDPQAIITLIPQGPLLLVPFAALQDSASTYLVDQHAIALVPSVQVLALTAQSNGELSTSLVVGNPVTMPTLPPGIAPLDHPLPPLPGAEAEAIAIAALLDTPPLVRQQATETAVVQRMSHADIIHLATHGLLNLDSQLNEFGQPTDANIPTANDASVYVTPGAVIVGDNVTVGGTDASVSLARERVVRVRAPGVLALAPSTPDDGWLTAAEIAGLNLRADLVVLSACDTGRGRITGDGVVGLSRAFLAAGADTVVVSLWQVPDDATAALMVTFYEQWMQTQNKALALQAAMQITKQKFPDPRNWSAFALVGEGR